MWEGYVQPNAANSALLPLDDVLPVVQPAQIYEGKSYAFIYGFMPGPVSIYYNEDHFAEAGLAAPTDEWMWANFRDAALKLTKSDNGNVTRWGANFDNWLVNWQYWAVIERRRYLQRRHHRSQSHRSHPVNWKSIRYFVIPACAGMTTSPRL